MNPLAKLRIKAGISQLELAKLVGTSQAQISRLEKGDRGLSRDWAMKLAPHLNTSPSTLMFADLIVPLVGFVGAGSQAHFYAESHGNLGSVSMPPGGTRETVAVEIRGDSLGSPFNGWTVYYNERRDPPTPDLIGELCVIGLGNGQILIKKLMRGREPGRYDLWSATESPMQDQNIAWAARVTAMLPPSSAKHEILNEPLSSYVAE
jgi:DNA-binding XRE family transcriptional regulator